MSTRIARLLKKLCAFCISITITVAVTAFSWQQIKLNDARTMHESAQTAVSEINLLLDEASMAIRQTAELSPRKCNDAMRRQLSRLAVGIEHIRVINIYREGVLVCSSYDAGDTAIRGKISSEKLQILWDSYFSPGAPVMVLSAMSGEYQIAASLSAHWSAMILDLLSVPDALSLQVGKNVLNRKNELTKARADAFRHIIYSGRYPFSVYYREQSYVSPSDYFSRGWLPFMLAVLLGLSGGGLAWKTLFRQKSSYELLADAIGRGEVRPWYQPVYDCSSGQITGVEVLARWITSSGQLKMPDSFIPLAENSDLIVPLTRSLMAQSAKELAVLLLNSRGLRIGFNFSRRHVREPDFVAECTNYSETFAKNGGTLVAELTERESFDNSETLKERVSSLHQNGIEIALDDFGTGYANLNYINQLHVDIIKIDRAFVARLNEPASVQLLGSIISMASALNLRIVAEGIETRMQAEWLAERGVVLHQGFLYSPPLPIDQLKQLMHKPARD